jgi:hypothetical protein
MIAARKLLPLAALAGLALSPSARAEDAAVVKRLEALGIKINTDGDGDYRVVYNYASEGRSQLVYIAGSTIEIRGNSVRKIFSPAALLSGGKVTGEQALALLGDSGRSAYGGWEIRSDVLYYAIEVPEPLTATALKSAMDVCAELADNKELELTGADEF